MIVRLSDPGVEVSPDTFAVKATVEDKNPYKVLGVPGNNPSSISQTGVINGGNGMNLDGWCEAADGESMIVVVDEENNCAYLYDTTNRGKK